MADQKLTALPAAGSLVTTDLVYAVTDPGGTPTSKSATVQNILDLVPAGAAGVEILDNSRPNITVNNTTAETDVYTYTVPGGTLGTTGRITLRFVGGKLKNGGGSEGTMILRVKWGGTEIFGVGVPTVSTDNTRLNAVIVTTDICANGATNAQDTLHTATFGTSPDNFLAVTPMTQYTAATIDSSINQILKVTWQNATTSLVHGFRSIHGTVTKP